MASSWDAGDQLITADGVIGVSGKPIRLFNMHIISGAGGGAIVSVRAGTVVGGTIQITETATASTGKTFDYGMHGHYFPTGAFVDVDTNTTSVLVSYSQG
jgi:hypothetical protein